MTMVQQPPPSWRREAIARWQEIQAIDDPERRRRMLRALRSEMTRQFNRESIHGPEYRKYERSRKREQRRQVVKRAARYSRAIWRWFLSGFAHRSDGEVARVAAICRGTETERRCEHWQPDEKVEGNGVCTHCGCRAGERRLVVANKWKWKTEHCPIGKW